MSRDTVLSYMDRHVKEKRNISDLGFQLEYIDEVLEEVKQLDSKMKPIFNTTQDGKDAKRKQYILSRAEREKGKIGTVISKVRSELKKLYTKNWFITEVTLLKSEKGCKKQILHCDWPRWKEKWNTGLFPCSGIVALQDKSSIIIGKSQSERTVLFAKGQLLVFKGNLFHRGAAYDEVNYRFHFTIGTERFEIPKNMVKQKLEIKQKKKRKKHIA